jgi:hypothetical protein
MRLHLLLVLELFLYFFQLLLLLGGHSTLEDVVLFRILNVFKTLGIFQIAKQVGLWIDEDHLSGIGFANQKHVTETLFIVPTENDMGGLESLDTKIFERVNVRVPEKTPPYCGIHIGKRLFNLGGTQSRITYGDPHEIRRGCLKNTEEFQGINDTITGFFHPSSEMVEIFIGHVEWSN